MSNIINRDVQIRRIYQTFRAFPRILKSLVEDSDNVILGGTASLALLGLNLSEVINDIDFVIYNTTKEQQTILNTLADLSEVNSYSKANNVKLSIGELKINFLVTKNKMPEYIDYSINGIKLKLGLVSDTMKAKLSYRDAANSPRAKDVKHLQDIIQNNFTFNLESDKLAKFFNEAQEGCATIL